MFGFALLSYPFISNYIFEKSAGSTIKSYEKQVKTYDQKQKEKAFEEAKEYMQRFGWKHVVLNVESITS